MGLTMCVSYNNNENMTRCEYTAVADEGSYSVVNLLADVDATMPTKFRGAHAFTSFEFQTANVPERYDNITYTVYDTNLDEEYVWLEFNGSSDDYTKFPTGVAEAGNDPRYQALELENDLDRGFDRSRGFVINKTMEPGTPIRMCVQYDQSVQHPHERSILRECEFEGIVDKGGWSAAGTRLVMNLSSLVDESTQVFRTGTSQ